MTSMKNKDINNSLADVTTWFRKYREQRPLPEHLLDKAYKEMCGILEKRCEHTPGGDVTKDTRWILDYATAMMRQLSQPE